MGEKSNEQETLNVQSGETTNNKETPDDKVLIFRGKYDFLSNLYPVELAQGKLVYRSAEHMYQAMKCAERGDRAKIYAVDSPKSAKILGRFLKKKPYWDVNRVQVMTKILKKKFEKPPLRTWLLNTVGKELINQSYDHDLFWSVCGCSKHERTGRNMLGQILMKIREEMDQKDIKKWKKIFDKAPNWSPHLFFNSAE